MKSSFILPVAVILSVYHVTADYQLILSQKDVRLATFDPIVKTTFLENPRRPNGNTFTNIGNLNPADFVGDNGYYRFKLVYTNLHSYTATNKVNNDLSVTLEWKQTSWLTATTITGYTPINVPSAPNIFHECQDFEGLGLSSSSQSFLDGDAHDCSSWWHSAGTITPYYDGIPAFDVQVAFTAALYVYSIPDCSVFDIDDYLLQCSNVFPQTLNSAKASPMGFIESETDRKNDSLWIKSIGLNSKDLFVISLCLVINLIGMIYNHYRIKLQEKRRFNGMKYAVQFDEEIDVNK